MNLTILYSDKTELTPELKKEIKCDKSCENDVFKTKIKSF